GPRSGGAAAQSGDRSHPRCDPSHRCGAPRARPPLRQLGTHRHLLLVPARNRCRLAMPGPIWRLGGMTTLLDSRTLQDRAIRAQADRALHVARATERPWFDDGELVVTWQGDRGVFTNLAVVLEPPSSWTAVVERVAEVVPTGRPAMLVSPYT